MNYVNAGHNFSVDSDFPKFLEDLRLHLYANKFYG